MWNGNTASERACGTCNSKGARADFFGINSKLFQFWKCLKGGMKDCAQIHGKMYAMHIVITVVVVFFFIPFSLALKQKKNPKKISKMAIISMKQWNLWQRR